MSSEIVDRELCPDCGRYVGPVSRCPYCDGVTAVTASRRRMKILALTLVIAGLGFLYMMAINHDINLVAINEITPMMNYAPVRVAGKVVRQPYVSKDEGVVNYLSFLVDDGSGSLRVSAQGKVAVALVASEKVPHKGDYVEVSGRLSVKGDGSCRLRILMSEQVISDPSSFSKLNYDATR